MYSIFHKIFIVMAELTVQPKRKPVWPWILVALLILAAIAYFVFNRNADGVFNDRDSVTNDTTYQYSPGVADTTTVPR
jgi:hypothetical protein